MTDESVRVDDGSTIGSTIEQEVFDPRTRSKRLGVAVAAVAMLVLSACGSGSGNDATTTDPGDGGGESASALLAQASETTGAVETGRIRMTTRFVTDGRGEPVFAAVSSEGTFADRGRSMEMTTDMTPLIAGAAEGDPDALSSFVQHQVQVGTELYMKIDTEPPMPGNPDKWIRMDMAEILDEDALAQAGQGVVAGGPGAYLEMMRAEGVTVREMGTDEIDGARVTVLAGEVDTETAIARAKPEVADEMRRTFRQMGMGPMPFKVYVDDDGMVRRMEMAMSQRSNGVEVEVVAIMDLYDFGAPATITAPPADEVVDASELDIPMFGEMTANA
jgi:hypothetical protein